ncbi:MAG TPA: hypothetical protein VHR45_18365 [Thermoanaerobaculia bacterium]|nr:hypothetical protein [Thermoanaerobaculia bacterium]
MKDAPYIAILAGVWANWNSVIQAARFVNDLRESVVTGQKGNRHLTLDHRRAMRFDWLLTMAGAIAVSVVFGVILLGIVLASVPASDRILKGVLLLLGLTPILGAVLFVLCGVNDWRLMGKALAAHHNEHLTEGRQVSTSISAQDVRPAPALQSNSPRGRGSIRAGRNARGAGGLAR